MLVAHSYGGLVAANAAEGFAKEQQAKEGRNGGIIMFVYLAAFVVPKGKGMVDMFGGQLPSWINVGTQKRPLFQYFLLTNMLGQRPYPPKSRGTLLPWRQRQGFKTSYVSAQAYVINCIPYWGSLRTVARHALFVFLLRTRPCDTTCYTKDICCISRC